MENVITSITPAGIKKTKPYRRSAKMSPLVPLLLSVVYVALVGVVWILNEGKQLDIWHVKSEMAVSSDQIDSMPSNTPEIIDEAFLSAQAEARKYGAKRFLAAGFEFTIGITTDGSCVTTGRYYPNVSEWTNMIALTANRYTVAGLCSDGTVLCSDHRIDVQEWKNIIQIEYGSELYKEEQHLVGLTDEGTVVAAGSNTYGECNVSGWTNIVDVSAGWSHTVGLRGDGTVVACGNNEFGQCEVSSWDRIVDVAASRYATYALNADGEILVAGYYGNQYETYVPDVPHWENVIAIIACNEKGNAKDFVVGICRNGTIVTNRVGYVNSAAFESFSDVQAVAVSSWGYTICSDSQGNVQDVGWNVDGTRRIYLWPSIKTK